MKPLDIKTAASVFKVTRATIYAKIKNGSLSRRSDKLLDFVELVRVFGEPSDRRTPQEKRQDMSNLVQSIENDKIDTSIHVEREAMQAQRIRELEDSLHKAEEREVRLMGQLDKLTDTVKLLNAPKADEEPPKKQGFFGRLFGRK
jgi:hypothetical protein